MQIYGRYGLFFSLCAVSFSYGRRSFESVSEKSVKIVGLRKKYKRVFFAVKVRGRRYEMELGYVVCKESTGHVGVFGVSHGHNADSSC